MLVLYHAPLACSLASRLALHESGLPHKIEFVHTTRGEQNAASYQRINPRQQVPALVTDNGVLTESTAILPYIADLVPEKGLLPSADAFARARAQSWLSFLSSTVHAAFGAAAMPKAGADNDTALNAAIERLAKAYRDVDTHLDGKDHLLESFSVCDIYLSVFALWRSAPAVAGKLPSFSNIDRLQQSVLGRPGYLAIIGEEVKLRSDA